MPEVIGRGDIQSIFTNTILMYKGTPYYFRGLNDDDQAVLDGYDGKQLTVDFALEDFKAPPRIGFVNHDRGATYVQRVPYRMYKMGLCADNTQMYGAGEDAINHINLMNKGFAAAIANQYPSLYKAWLLVKERGYGAVAFDKQFAIDPNRTIWYKADRAGRIPAGFVRRSCIQWDAGYEFCNILLEPNYEETESTFEFA